MFIVLGPKRIDSSFRSATLFQSREDIALLTERRVLLLIMRASYRYLIALLISIAITAFAQVAVLTIASHAQAPRGAALDLLILHGKLVDGSGRKPRVADLGI